jgi:hypothetical protein
MRASTRRRIWGRGGRATRRLGRPGWRGTTSRESAARGSRCWRGAAWRQAARAEGRWAGQWKSARDEAGRCPTCWGLVEAEAPRGSQCSRAGQRGALFLFRSRARRVQACPAGEGDGCGRGCGEGTGMGGRRSEAEDGEGWGVRRCEAGGWRWRTTMIAAGGICRVWRAEERPRGRRERCVPEC